MLHIPVLRTGRAYKSLDVARVSHHATRQPFVDVSQANGGLIRRDLLGQGEARAALARLSVADLLERCRDAADAFQHETLPLGDDRQRPDDYVEQLSATTGMPYAMVRRNMQRVASVLTNLTDILAGLTRGLDLSVLDRGYGDHDGQMVSFAPRTQALGVVLPSNSPGVHGLWLPAIPLKTPLVLRPGNAEPWTPFRLAQAMMHAGIPREAFFYFPSDHAGAGEIVRQCGRSMFFGDIASVGLFANDPRVEIHGPGYTKIIVGPDMADEAPTRHLEVIARSVVANGGRSCVNASGIWMSRNAEATAHALARRLAAIEPRAVDDPAAEIAPFADPSVARRIDAQIDAALDEPGALDVTARYRSGPRLAERDGCTYLRPTVVLCNSSSHALANREFLFPFVSVVQVTDEEMASMPDCLGPTLAAMVLTGEEGLIQRLLASDRISRLNIGPIATNEIAWNQPHEGNLFEHLYSRRSLQRTA
jgi:acyl-CoA reductase-like NAD-dependent aldehyde dehydrogenase